MAIYLTGFFPSFILRLYFFPTPFMATRRYKVAELHEWYRSISKAHRDYFRISVRTLIDEWIIIHNTDGALPAMQWWKENTRRLVPIQRAAVDYLLQRTIRNGANFTFSHA